MNSSFAGSAGTGIAGMPVEAMKADGIDEDEARRHVWLYDTDGLIQSKRDGLADFQQLFAHDHEAIETFVTAIEAMARLNDRPTVFPYSNPTSRSECIATEAYEWSGGKYVKRL